MKLGTTDISAIKLGSTGISKAYLGSSVVYEESTTEYTGFYVEDISGSNNTVSIIKNHSSAPTLTIEKSLDGKSWETMGSTSTTAITATVPANGKLYLRCITNAWGNPNYCYNTINCSSQFNVGGNIMSLLNGSFFTGKETKFPGGSTYTFMCLFIRSTTLVSAENLLLPATTLVDACYYNSFGGCTSLTTAPELPATTLAQKCYIHIFSGCTSLNYIKVGFTVWPNMSSSSASDYQATYSWTRLSVNTTGTFVCPAALTKYFNKSGNNTTGSSSISSYTNAIPYGWTVQTY